MDFIKEEIGRSVKHIMGDFPKIFEKVSDKEVDKIDNLVSKIKDNIINDYVRDMVRFTVNIEEEVVNISFYNKLIKEKRL